MRTRESAEVLVLPRSLLMRRATLIVALAAVVSGCAGTRASDPCADAFPGGHFEGTFETERLGPLAEQTDLAYLTGWVTDGYTGVLAQGAGVSVDSLALGANTDSLGHFRFALPPGRHRLTVRYVGAPSLNVPVVVAASEVVEVHARLGASVTETGVCVSFAPAAAR